MSIYAERDPRVLEPHLSRHMEAMTAEGLHDKGAIAIELAWRDAEIERLNTEIAKRDALMDSQYIAGARAGWNAAQRDNPNEAFARIERAYEGRLAALAKEKDK
jgi:hypothetical protein